MLWVEGGQGGSSRVIGSSIAVRSSYYLVGVADGYHCYAKNRELLIAAAEKMYDIVVL
jgi:hypothetical protein